MLKGRKRKRKLAVRNGDAVDETVESETGSGSVTTSSDLASPAKVTVLSGICALQLSQTFFWFAKMAKPYRHIYENYYYYTRFIGLFSRTTWVRQYQKGKTSLDSNEARDGGSGVSWTICKQSAPRCRQITTPTPHHSILLAGCSS